MTIQLWLAKHCSCWLSKFDIAFFVTSHQFKKSMTNIDFPKKIFPELKKLNGQKGAKSIFQKYKDDIKAVEFPAGAFDIDTPEDLVRLTKLTK